MKKATEWISVRDKLPEAPGRYLVYTRDGRMQGFIYSASGEEFGMWLPRYCQDESTGEMRRVGDEWYCEDQATHWMPIQEPPKETHKEPWAELDEAEQWRLERLVNAARICANGRCSIRGEDACPFLDKRRDDDFERCRTCMIEAMADSLATVYGLEAGGNE